MATPPSFTAGSVLTAAQMNAVGLWLVKSQTVGTGVSSFSVTDAFSSDYDNYIIQWNGGTSSAGTNLRLSFGSTNTGYYSSLIYAQFGGSTVAATGQSNAAYFDWAGHAWSNRIVCDINVQSPNLAKYTNVQSLMDNDTDNGRMFGVLKNTTQYTAFTITPATGTLTGGTCRVYGYRN